MKRWLLRTCLIVLLLCAATKIMADERLKPCPDSPNCVSSLAEGDEHRIAPMSYGGDRATARLRLLAVLSEFEDAQIIEDTELYLRVTVTSAVLRFIDDVTFFFDDEKALIQMRSASRSGYYDFGANRRRLEGIRQLYEQQ
ncbi:hypothetical protein MNBD_GAMMA17-480 [hydrothermal vent metagenome]|uniref:DUF1499 domain-containing protein n=1 Tax=hydrothermal vent metagenome TaxID=652676 RepID=A0A3B0ZM20_9ZZZZ